MLSKVTTYLLFIASFLLLTPAVNAQLLEDFEEGSKGSYAAGSVTLESGSWLFNDALIGTLDGDKKNGTRSARVRGFIEMEFDKPDGADQISFYSANFGNDSGGQIQVHYSTDSGSTWQELGDPVTVTSTLSQYTKQASVEGSVRVRFEKVAGDRINIDDVSINDFVEIVEKPTLSIRVDNDIFQNGDTFNFPSNTGSSSAVLQLRNTGQEDLEILSYSITNPDFSLVDDPTGTIESLGSIAVNLEFSSDQVGLQTGEIVFETNDPDNEEFVLNLAADVLDTTDPMPIAEARELPQGTLVTVSGWVTVSDQFAGPVYFQDETGGIAWYNNDSMRNEWLLDIQLGDSVVVTGELGNFNQLLQIVDEDAFIVFSEANRLIEPETITLTDMNSGNYEAQLIKINGIEFSDSGTFSGDSNYDVSDASGQGELRVSRFTDLVGVNIPVGEANVTGVAGRFGDTRQLQPRMPSDVQEAAGPVITSSAPYEVSISSGSITFEWSTEAAGHSEVRYGTTPDLELGFVSDESPKTDHSITLDGLDPATVYKIQLRSAAGTDTSFTNTYITSTASPEGTTGEILTYFNKSVDHTLATFREADQNVNFRDKLIERIDAAEESATLAFYSISGSVGSEIGDAIIDAHNRGVAVRVIASGHTGNVNQVISNLQSAGVHAVQSTGNEQQHNKFAVFDAHHPDPTKSWVVTSSWNATDSGTFSQFQNMLNIQDVSLARAYTLEFNQMWGGDSGSFNASAARFSSSKDVVNPSIFFIGEDETEVRLYFSPQGNTEAQIASALASAESSINIGLNLITRRSLSDVMRNRFDEGVAVRGVIGQTGGQASQWDYLRTWADVHEFSQSQFGLLHHKYAIVDGEAGTDNSKVITGSHNWSNNANTRNDENTLIIRSPRVANEFVQEFAMRYSQAGGEDSIIVTSSEGIADIPQGFEVHQNYPNPFNPSTNISFSLSQRDDVSVRVFDVMGREVARLLNDESFNSGTHQIMFDASQLSSGMYIYQVSLGSGHSQTGKMTLVK